MRNATELGYTHAEAYMLMQYESDDGRHRLVVWNSRDGVTPFCITHPDSRVELRHVRWAEDQFLGPKHEPAQGDWIFIDLTEEEARRAATKNAHRWWDHPQYPAKKQFGSIEEMVDVLSASYLDPPGQPHLTQVVW